MSPVLLFCFISYKLVLDFFKRKKQPKQQTNPKPKHLFPFLVPKNSHQQQCFQPLSVSFGFSPALATEQCQQTKAKEPIFLFKDVLSPEISGHCLLKIPTGMKSLHKYCEIAVLPTSLSLSLGVLILPVQCGKLCSSLICHQILLWS